MQKIYKFIGSIGVGSFKDITLGLKRKSKFTVQSNGKARLGNCGRWYLRVTQENDGLSDNQE